MDYPISKREKEPFYGLDTRGLQYELHVGKEENAWE